MNQELVSVIIPIYNVQDYLARCLESVLNNTYTDLEVICVDDGSTDDSLALARNYADKDSRVVVYTQPNQGVSAARNLGIEKAHGDYLTFVDADDFIHHRYIEVMMTCMCKTDAKLVYCLYTEFQELSQISNEMIGDKALSWEYSSIDMDSFLYDRKARTKCWGKIYKREFLPLQGYPVGITLGEDSIFVLRYLSRIQNDIYQCSDMLYFYEMGRQNSAIHVWNGDKVLDCIDIYKEDAKWMPDNTGKYCIINGLKEVLIIRYSNMLEEKRPEIAQKCKNLGRELLNQLKRSSASTKEKVSFHLFYWSPFLYRVYRIIDDPSMLKYEKNLREKRKRGEL